MNDRARRAPQDPSVDGPISNPRSKARERNPRAVIAEIAAAVEAQRRTHAAYLADVAPHEPSVRIAPFAAIAPVTPVPVRRQPLEGPAPEAQTPATQPHPRSTPEDA